MNAVNYNANWEGEDGNGNPWLDRRVAAGFSAAIDRFLMIDTVYLGDARLTADAGAPWFDEFWALPADEVLTIPGYRPDREADIAYTRQMLDAAGLPADYTFRVMVPDLWEATYPGITETSKAMYEEATQRSFAIEVQPYTVILQRLVEGTYPGAIPAWTNPPSVLDPTGGWRNTILPGGSANLLFYDFPPTTELVTRMQTTIDMTERREMALEVQRILMGVHPDHGLAGFTVSNGVMNGIQRITSWPYVHASDDVFQFAAASHRHDETWLDSNHPDFPT